MKLHLVALSLAVALVGVVAVRAEDKKSFVGTWQVIACEKEGNKESADQIKGRTVQITQDRITVRDASGKTLHSCTYRLGGSGDNRTVMLTSTEGDNKGQTMEGIYKLDGDTLTVCYAEQGGSAPKEFRTAAGSKQCCMVLKRSTEK